MRATFKIQAKSEQALMAAMQRKKTAICDRIARQAERNASAATYNRGQTPGVDYEATVEPVGRLGNIRVTLEANPRNDHADMMMRIAVGGRKQYEIRARKKGALAWDSRQGLSNSRSGKWVVWVPKDIYAIQGRSASKVTIPARAPTLEADFLDRALNNAIARVRNDYR